MWYPVCDLFEDSASVTGVGNSQPSNFSMAFKTGLAFTPSGPDLGKCIFGKERIEAFSIDINPDLVPIICEYDLLDAFSSISECHMIDEDEERYYMNLHVKTNLSIVGHGKFNGYCLRSCMIRIDKAYVEAIWKDFDHMVKAASIKVAMDNIEHIIVTIIQAISISPNSNTLRNRLLIPTLGHIVSHRTKIEKVSIINQEGETRICRKI